MIRRDDHDNTKNSVDKDALLKTVLMHNQELVEQIKNLTEQNQKLTEQNEQLSQKVIELIQERDKNSRNSNKPPSSDGLGNRRSIRKKKKTTGRKKGGQPGHKGNYRKLLPVEEVDEIINVYPDLCEICQRKPPQVKTRNPRRHQVVEVMENGRRQTTEYNEHFLRCECGELVKPSRDKVPSSAFGPRLKSLVCTLTGGYQLSRRQVPEFLKDVFSIDISLGSVSNIEGQMSKALEEPSDEALEYVESASFKHLDETSWIRDWDPCSVWVLAYNVVSVFRIVANGRRSTLLKILQRKNRGILISDRAPVFLFWSMNKRQICWSHLLRAFIGFSQRDGPAAVLGKDLVTCAELVLSYWRQYCSGDLSREQFEQWMEAVKKNTRQILERAKSAGIAQVSGSCANVLQHWDAMWTFVNTKGVEPTNNHAERELRRLVIWRKKCFGTQSERGDRFVERMMTVTHTLRKQGKRVLSYLQKCFQAMLRETPVPKLVTSS